MPGVPTGRACDGCRKQKKKCDEKTPTCSRCLRLRIKCIGSGQRRYKFYDHNQSTIARKAENSSSGSSIFTRANTPEDTCFIISRADVERNMSTLCVVQSITATPSNKITMLTSRYIHTIQLSPDLRYNLAWAYGLFMLDIPRRMNTNEALDSAVKALMCAHSDLCNGHEVSIESLRTYSRALLDLRVCLSDPAKALTTETLCAIMLLLICQNINGSEGQRWSGHSEGAAQILKARASMKPRNEFEQQLLMSLRGCVLFEGLLNERISLTSEEWTSLVGSDLDNNLPEGKLMRCLARIPIVIRRRRNSMSMADEIRKGEFLALRAETKVLYESSKLILEKVRENWVAASCKKNKISTNDKRSLSKDLTATLLHAYYQRIYGLGLMILTTMNCVYRNFVSVAEQQQLLLDAKQWAKETLHLAELANRYRPLGSAYMMVALSVTWLAAADNDKRVAAEIGMSDYARDFPMRATLDVQALEWMERELEALRVRDDELSYISSDA